MPPTPQELLAAMLAPLKEELGNKLREAATKPLGRAVNVGIKVFADANRAGRPFELGDLRAVLDAYAGESSGRP